MMADNFRKVKQVLWLILFANLTVAVLKIIIGTAIKSTSLTADGFHSFTDGTSNIVGLIGIWFASKPVDEDHPYGHRKFEILAGLFIAGMLFIIGERIVLNAIDRLINPILPQITLESLIVLIITLCINILVCKFEYNRGKKLNSQILISDSVHTKSDIYVSVGVLLTIAGIKLGLPPVIDPIISFIVAIYIFYASYEIFKYNSGILVDKAALDVDEIKDIVLSFEQVKDVHNIRSRGSQNEIHVDMHIMTEPNLSVEKSHELIHSIEDELRERINTNLHLIAHLEPYDSIDN